MLTLLPAAQNNIAQIKSLLDTLDLTKENQTYENFYLAQDPVTNQPIGVVQLEEYPEFYFLNSLGIAPKMQGRGLGTKLLKQLLNLAAQKNYTKPVYLRTIIPQFFKKAGFRVVKESPAPANFATKRYPLNAYHLSLPPKENAECRWCQPEKCTLMIKLPGAA